MSKDLSPVRIKRMNQMQISAIQATENWYVKNIHVDKTHRLAICGTF